MNKPLRCPLLPACSFIDMLHPTTMKSIARQLGVTVSTVSRALQDHPRIGLRTRERVQELAGQLGYVPNSMAINLK